MENAQRIIFHGRVRTWVEHMQGKYLRSSAIFLAFTRIKSDVSVIESVVSYRCSRFEMTEINNSY